MVGLGVENVIFVDDTFNVPEERFRQICRLMINERLPVHWYSYFRCSSVKDETTFDLMQQSGCRGVFLGIESGDDDILKNMNKVAATKSYKRGIEQLKKRGILTFASFIAGYTGETAQTIKNTIEFINEAAPDLYRMEPWWFNKQSPIGRASNKFRIEGEGHSWTHSTMTSEEACDAIDRVFEEVKYSAWCPQQSFSFWAIPYLIGKGMLMDQVMTFHRLCHAVLTKQTKDMSCDGELAALDRFVSTLSLDDPKFSLPRHG